MRIKKILSGSIAGSIAMTMFTHIVSDERGNLFKETLLLNLLLGKPYSSYSSNKKKFKGWMLHYAVGLFFTMVYDQLWRKTSLKPNFTNGFLLGSVNGVMAVAAWHYALSQKSIPLFINKKRRYLDLLAAHSVFGVFTVLGYRLPDYPMPEIGQKKILTKANALSPARRLLASNIQLSTQPLFDLDMTALQ